MRPNKRTKVAEEKTKVAGEKNMFPILVAMPWGNSMAMVSMPMASTGGSTTMSSALVPYNPTAGGVAMQRDKCRARALPAWNTHYTAACPF